MVSWFANPAMERVQSFLLCHFVLTLQRIWPTCYVGIGKRFFNLWPCWRVLCLITHLSLVKFQEIVLTWFSCFMDCRPSRCVACVSEAEHLLRTQAFLSELSCARAWNERKIVGYSCKMILWQGRRSVVIAVVSLVMKMVMGWCSNLTSLVPMVLCKRLSKALESLTMSHFIIAQKTIAVKASALPERVRLEN